MKRSAFILTIIFTALFLLASAGETRAETAQKYNLSFGGYLGLGCATTLYDNRDVAFAIGVEPEMQFFVIDKLSITYRFLWERIFYDHQYEDLYRRNTENAAMDIAPFLLGVRYYFTLANKLKLYTGLGLGCTVYRVEFDDTGWYSRLAFAFDGYVGLEYEVYPQLAVGGMFNIMVPNIGPLESDENIIGRFMFHLGVNYYVSTTSGSGQSKSGRKRR